MYSAYIITFTVINSLNVYLNLNSINETNIYFTLTYLFQQDYFSKTMTIVHSCTNSESETTQDEDIIFVTSSH